MTDAIGDALAENSGHETAPEPQPPAAPAGGERHAVWLAPIILVAAWAVPGLGHALLRKWARAAGFFIAVGGLAITGYLMRGEVFGPHAHESFGTLGFLADAGAGGFYFLAHAIETAGPDISRATGNYGTRFVAAAGLVNLIGAIDAVETALGRRE
ncbi:MAG TPA: DUF6677 family protein [Candidatus Dormibacteraeota bacterium]|nr:DUF6677 family protein [Candidatus Dormibacteraeota bacterium]